VRARLWTVAAILGAVAATAGAEEPALGDERPTVAAALDTLAAPVGGRLNLTIEIRDSPGWRVEPPAKALDLSPFRIRGITEVPREGGRAYELALVPLEAGEVEVPPVPFVIRGPDDVSDEIATEPILVAVGSNLPAPAPPAEGEAPATPEPADLKPPLDPPRKWWPVAAAAALLALVAAAAFFLVRRLRNRVKEPEEKAAPSAPRRPAWEIAFEELERIAAAQYVQNGEFRRQYTEVSETLRRYLENRWGVPALESTTEDLNELLRASPVETAVSARILSVLREADLVKFAKAQPFPEDARASEGRVRGVVEDTIPRPEVPSTPAPVPAVSGDGARP
jgi:hypothetical protein